MREKINQIQKQMRKKIFSYISAGFGLVAALAWNDAIKTLIQYFFPLDKNGLLAKFIYAFFVTIILVIISVYLVKLLGQEQDK